MDTRVSKYIYIKFGQVSKPNLWTIRVLFILSFNAWESDQWGIKQILLLHQMVSAIYDLLTNPAENAEILWSRLIK